MGWFDESDDEEVAPRRAALLDASDLDDVHSSQKGQDGNGQNEQEEDDPLDAYMNSLKGSDEGNGNLRAKRQRLDVENEEEATSHWKERTASSRDWSEEEDPNISQQNAKAREEFQSTFRKAGEKNRDVDIHLDKVHHVQQNYQEFRRKFWSTTNTTAGHDWRKSHGVSCHPPTDPIYELDELKELFGPKLQSWCLANGFVKPTPVQSQSLSVSLSGRDTLITSATGSGKTLAYLWSMVVHLCQNSSVLDARGLVLVPTRELALQVSSVATKLAKNVGLKALAITGGNMGRYQLSQEIIKLQPSILIATPGRLLDVLSVNKNKAILSLKQVTFVVLDECDKMLQMGFSNQVTQILDNIRPDRLSMMLSATMGRRIEQVAAEWLSNPIRISVGRAGVSSINVDQHVMVLPNVEAKTQFIIQMLPSFSEVGRVLVFCATRNGCDELADKLRTETSLALDTLHGDKHQSDRKSALKAFATGKISVLVATDVAGRGLDIPKVATVILYDPAKNLDTHVHRVGRAGRLSNTEGVADRGSAYSLLTPRDADFARVLKGSFEREGRTVSAELEMLASKSKTGTGDSRKRSRWQPTGLGFQE